MGRALRPQRGTRDLHRLVHEGLTPGPGPPPSCTYDRRVSATADQGESTVTARALVIVRNGVTHDARVLRAASTLELAGFDALIVGVVTDAAREHRTRLDGIAIVRLDPRLPLRNLARRLRAAAPRAGEPPAPPAARTAAPVTSAPVLGWPERLARLASTADYYRRAIGVVLRTRPAILHANDYNTMWVGVAAKYLVGSRVVYDAHELWPDRNGRWESRWWLLACEALFVRVADAVVTASPGYATCMARRYRIAPPAVVRNIPSACAPSPRGAAARTGPPEVVYAGGLLRGRGLEQSIDALALVAGVKLALIGPGRPAYLTDLRERAVHAGVAERVEFRAPVPPGELVDALAGADLGLSLIQPVCLSYELTLPNKVFEYIAAGLPVLVSDLPVMAAFVAEHRVGEVVAPGDPVAIAAAIERLTAPGARAALQPHVTTAAQTLTWERERAILLAAYRGVVPVRQASSRPL